MPRLEVAHVPRPGRGEDLVRVFRRASRGGSLALRTNDKKSGRCCFDPCPIRFTDRGYFLFRTISLNAISTNDGDYPESWLANESFFFHDTPEGCCEALGFGDGCRVRDAGCGTAGPDGGDDDGEACLDDRGEARPWHMSTVPGEARVCTNDGEFPEQWRRPGASSDFLFGTHGECCARFGWADCGRRDVCDGPDGRGDGDGGGAGSDGGDGPCGARGYHPDITAGSGCTNDGEIDPRWLDMPGVFHETGEGCCRHFAHRAECAVRDVCGGTAADPPADGDGGGSGGPDGAGAAPGPAGEGCVTHGWHVDLVRKDGCTNDGNIEQDWLDPAIVSLMLHPTADGCCEVAFRDGACAHNEVTGCEYVDPAGVGEERDCDVWHPGESSGDPFPRRIGLTRPGKQDHQSHIPNLLPHRPL